MDKYNSTVVFGDWLAVALVLFSDANDDLYIA